MECILKKSKEEPFLYSKNNIINEVNEEFINLTGYSNNELIGKSLTEISNMLRLDSQIYIENIENEYSCYMFTKEYEPIEITISCKGLNSKNEKMYFIKENTKSSLKERFDSVKQLYTDSKAGFSIVSIPDLILLKVNQNYLNTLDEPYNKMANSIGKKLKEIITGYEGSEAAEIWNSVITTGKAYHVEEFQYDYFSRGVTYWNSAVVPIFVEGKVKYIINNMLDVTEKVLDKKLLHEQVEIIKEQKEQLEAIIENVSDGVFISNKEGKYIKVNSKLIDICPADIMKYVGDSHKVNKYFDMLGNEIAIENMPIRRALNGHKVKNEKILVKSFSKEQTIEVNATPIFDVNSNIVMGAVFYNNITNLYNKEKIIKEQKDELEVIIENMSDGVFIIEKDNKIIQLNSRSRELVYSINLFGKRGDTLKHTKYYDSEDNLLHLEDFLSERVLLNGERLKDCRITGHTPDGIYNFSLSGSPVHDENGNVLKAIICIRDITEHVNKDEMIRQEKQKLEAILENMSDKILFINKNGDYTMINKMAKSNPFYDFERLKNTQTDFEQEEYFDMDGNLISYQNRPALRIIRGEKISGCTLVTKNKKSTAYIEVTGTPLYDKVGDFIGGVMIYHDITEMVKNQENLLLKTQYNALNTIIENLYLGYTLVSYPDLTIKYINNKSYRILKGIDSQIELSTIMGGNIFDIFKYNICEKTKAKNKIKSLIEKKSKSCFYYKKHIKAEKEKFCKIIFQPIVGLNNEVIELIFITIDMTEEIESRNKMEETLKIQDEIFSNISHELKTPLNVIFSTNQLMEFYLKNGLFETNNKKFSNGINIIKQNCYRLTKLVNNVIDVSKVESGFLELNLSNQNIVNIIEDIVQSVSDYIKIKELNIIFDTNIEEKIIACDPNKIERIILNLISNAIKFTNATGSIFVNLIDKGDTVEISVKDTGVGMDKKHLNDIFKRFYKVNKSLSRNTEGSGIGLSLVKSIVELHGGKISAKSKPNEGSIFKIELPAKTIENPKVIEANKLINSKIETINIEFSDIYSI